MYIRTLEFLSCPECGSDLTFNKNVCVIRNDDIITGSVTCSGCINAYPILSGVLVLVQDVRHYLFEHVSGISRYTDDSQIPKDHRAMFIKIKKNITSQHIAEDIEAERVTALYVMTQYMKGCEVHSPSEPINEIIKKYWDEGPHSKIKNYFDNIGGNPSMVELGCGVGGLYSILKSNLSSYLGVDFSFASIALARHLALGAELNCAIKIPGDLLEGAVSNEITLDRPSVSKNADFIVCQLENPPLKHACWDVSAALNIIDMLHDPESLPKLQANLLKVGGTAIQSSPYIWHPDVAKALMQRLPPDVRRSDLAVEWLYTQNGFSNIISEKHIPWVFFKNERQIELYSTHLFTATK